nr:HAMP domain-containing sensor histidine kinase [Cupriavidus gilardii]
MTFRSRHSRHASAGNRTLSLMLSLTLSGVIALVAIAHAAWTYSLANTQIHSLLDRRLQEVAARIDDHMASMPASPYLFRDVGDGIVVQVWPRQSEPRSQVDAGGLHFGRDIPEGFSTQQMANERWRVYAQRGRYWAVHVGQRDASRRRIAKDAAVASAAPALALIPLAWLAIFITVRRAFHRIGSLGEQAAQLDIGNLRPLPTDKVPGEVLPLVRSINLMIARLSQSLQAEKKFIADAAHELRSPLTSLQIQADNLGRTLTDPNSVREYVALQKDIARSARMISQLLRLARADAALDAAPGEAVRLREVVPDVIESHLPRAAARHIDLGVDRLDDLRVRASAADLRTAISNLVDNAIKYTPDGGTVDVRAYGADGFACIEVRDTGRGLAPEALPRVFDRFFRADPDGTEGSGLGLAIVRAIVEKHGGDASIDNRGDVPSGAVARLRFRLSS